MYVVVFGIAFFLYAKTVNSERRIRRLASSILKSAFGCYPNPLPFTLWAGFMHLKFFKPSMYDTA
jgi:hypothetical protein